MYEIRTTQGIFWSVRPKPERTKQVDFPNLEGWRVAVSSRKLGYVERHGPRTELEAEETMLVQINPAHIVAIVPLD